MNNRLLSYLLVIAMCLPLVLCTFNIASHNHIQNITETPFNGLVFVNNGASGSVIRRWREDGKWHCYVLTGNHCVTHVDADKQTVEFRMYDSRGRITKSKNVVGKLVEASEYHDYAIIKCETDFYMHPIKCIHPSDADGVGMSDQIYCTGCPAGEYVWVGKGYIASLNPRQPNSGWYGHNAGIWYGNSGGPLLDEDFLQIGVNLQIKIHQTHGMFGQSVYTAIPTIAFSLPLKQVYQKLGPEKVEEFFGFSVDKCPLRRIISL